MTDRQTAEKLAAVVERLFSDAGWKLVSESRVNEETESVFASPVIDGEVVEVLVTLNDRADRPCPNVTVELGDVRVVVRKEVSG